VDDLVVLRTVGTSGEASVVLGFLREEGIECFDRPTNFAVGASDGYPSVGPREIVVRGDDVGRARELLDRRLPV
jgi:Putative prokaryotic signal transducing protein